MLDKGQEADWFGSALITTFAAVAVLAFIAVILWELWLVRRKQRPVLDLYLFKNRTFAISMVMMFVVGATLYAINTLITQLLQNLMGYTAQQSGEAQIWGGVATMLCMALVGAISAKIDNRKLIAFGFAITAASLFYMAGLDLLMSFGHASLLKFYQGFGIAFLFIPISTMSYVGISEDKSNDVSGMTNLARTSVDHAVRLS